MADSAASGSPAVIVINRLQRSEIQRRFTTGPPFFHTIAVSWGVWNPGDSLGWAQSGFNDQLALFPSPDCGIVPRIMDNRVGGCHPKHPLEQQLREMWGGGIHARSC